MIDELTDALNQLNEAYETLNRAKRECQEDWDYFCHREIREVEIATERFSDALNAIIDERVSERLELIVSRLDALSEKIQ